MKDGIAQRLQERGAEHGLRVDSELAERLAIYVRELAHWNRTINLTAFRLDPEPTDAALDRLIFEPVAAARLLPGDGLLLDVGSGGGSPAIPLKLARPDLALRMVELRARKAAFLRHVARTLELVDTHVHAAVVETLVLPEGLRATVIAMRAVRFDAPIAAALARLLVPGGTMLRFGAPEHSDGVLEPWRHLSTHRLLNADPRSTIQVLGIPAPIAPAANFT